MDTTTLYWECGKCKAKSNYTVDDLIALEMANGGCPHCGHELTLEPNCYICKYRNDILGECQICKSMDGFKLDKGE